MENKEIKELTLQEKIILKKAEAAITSYWGGNGKTENENSEVLRIWDEIKSFGSTI